MKKLYVLFSLIAIIALTGCKKDSTSTESATGFDNKAMISEIFAAGMSWDSHKKEMKSTVPINIEVDNTVQGPQGGSIHVLGSVTGSMTINDQTSAILGGTMLLGLTETINKYAFRCNGSTYTMNGAPYISLSGTFTLLPGGSTYGTASSMQIGGGVRVTGPEFDETINIDITINVNPNGTGGSVSGTIGGLAVNFAI